MVVKRIDEGEMDQSLPMPLQREVLVATGNWLDNKTKAEDLREKKGQ